MGLFYAPRGWENAARDLQRLVSRLVEITLNDRRNRVPSALTFLREHVDRQMRVGWRREADLLEDAHFGGMAALVALAHLGFVFYAVQSVYLPLPNRPATTHRAVKVCLRHGNGNGMQAQAAGGTSTSKGRADKAVCLAVYRESGRHEWQVSMQLLLPAGKPQAQYMVPKAAVQEPAQPSASCLSSAAWAAGDMRKWAPHETLELRFGAYKRTVRDFVLANNWLQVPSGGVYKLTTASVPRRDHASGALVEDVRFEVWHRTQGRTRNQPQEQWDPVPGAEVVVPRGGLHLPQRNGMQTRYTSQHRSSEQGHGPAPRGAERTPSEPHGGEMSRARNADRPGAGKAAASKAPAPEQSPAAPPAASTVQAVPPAAIPLQPLTAAQSPWEDLQLQSELSIQGLSESYDNDGADGSGSSSGSESDGEVDSEEAAAGPHGGSSGAGNGGIFSGSQDEAAGGVGGEPQADDTLLSALRQDLGGQNPAYSASLKRTAAAIASISRMAQPAKHDGKHDGKPSFAALQAELKSIAGEAATIMSATAPSVIAVTGEAEAGKSHLLASVINNLLKDGIAGTGNGDGGDVDHAEQQYASDLATLKEKGLVAVQWVPASAPCAPVTQAPYNDALQEPHLGPETTLSGRLCRDAGEADDDQKQELILPTDQGGAGVTGPPVKVVFDAGADVVTLRLSLRSERQVLALFARCHAQETKEEGEIVQQVEEPGEGGEDDRIEADTPMLCAVLGVKKKDVDWTAAPVPGIFRKHKEVIFTVNPSHKGWRRFVRRILYRYTVRGNFGLVRSVELTVPSRMEVPFSLLDTGGWNGAEEYRSKITLEALADSNIAVLCLVVNHRNVPGLLERVAEKIGLLNRLSGNGAPIRVMTVYNYGMRELQRFKTWGDFEAAIDRESVTRKCWDFAHSMLLEGGRNVDELIGYMPLFLTEDIWKRWFRIDPQEANMLGGYMHALQQRVCVVQQEFHARQQQLMTSCLARMFVAMDHLVQLDVASHRAQQPGAGAGTGAGASAGDSIVKTAQDLLHSLESDLQLDTLMAGVCSRLDNALHPGITDPFGRVTRHSVQEALHAARFHERGTKLLNNELSKLSRSGGGKLPDLLYKVTVPVTEDTEVQIDVWASTRMAVVQAATSIVQGERQQLLAHASATWQVLLKDADPHVPQYLRELLDTAQQRFVANAAAAMDVVMERLAQDMAGIADEPSLMCAYREVLAVPPRDGQPAPPTSLHMRALNSSRMNNQDKVDWLSERAPGTLRPLASWMLERAKYVFRQEVSVWKEYIRALLEDSVRLLEAVCKSTLSMGTLMERSPIYRGSLRSARLLNTLRELNMAGDVEPSIWSKVEICISGGRDISADLSNLAQMLDDTGDRAQKLLEQLRAKATPDAGPSNGAAAGSDRACAWCGCDEFERGRNRGLSNMRVCHRVNIIEGPSDGVMTCRRCKDTLRDAMTEYRTKNQAAPHGDDLASLLQQVRDGRAAKECAAKAKEEARAAKREKQLQDGPPSRLQAQQGRQAASLLSPLPSGPQAGTPGRAEAGPSGGGAAAAAKREPMEVDAGTPGTLQLQQQQRGPQVAGKEEAADGGRAKTLRDSDGGAGQPDQTAKRLRL